MSALQIQVGAIGLNAPGLPDWQTGAAVLRGEQAQAEGEFRFVAPGRLPRNERRRATPITRLAFAACEDALRAQAPNLGLHTVFASCSGDFDIIDKICRALSTDPHSVSPMHFHNSVHNAPAGYWSIACGETRPSVSLSARDASVAAGLIEAALQLQDAPEQPVLLVCYDVATPPPLSMARPIPIPFACALLLSADDEGTGLSLELVDDQTPASRMDGELEQLRLANPAARALPLLQALATGQATRVTLPASHGQLRICVIPGSVRRGD